MDLSVILVVAVVCAVITAAIGQKNFGTVGPFLV